MLIKGDMLHFIAIGGSIMHNLAINLQSKGLIITGSDDEIFEPAKSKLQQKGLLPAQEGWFPEKIHSRLAGIILGMHARKDNPELLRAQALGLKIWSFPEFIFEQSRDKQRIVIAGSHGKTSITSMIMHVLKFHNREFDYVVGAQLDGFDTMVSLSDAPVIIIEGDEYPASALDVRPKFLHYHHHVALISGIAWDHFNIYKDFDSYVKQFELLADRTPKAGVLIFNEEDDLVSIICKKERPDVTILPYKAHKHQIDNHTTKLINGIDSYPVSVFGYHNMQNIEAARVLLDRIGISEKQFYAAIGSFKGASKRMELLGKNASTSIFKDFAHAPSKLQASTKALKNQYPKRRLCAVVELHTFSSLNKDFINQYKGTFNDADEAIVYYNPRTVEHKKLEMLSDDELKNAFGRKDLLSFTDINKLEKHLRSKAWDNANLLMMSSGNFNGLNLPELAQDLLKA
jgi:UDP-N-acetylmuramate: L-alanyl-gamma-D-glutamyl-meso-diaminopimelate ligase